MTVQEKIKQLKSQGIPIYSISKLNTMDECLWSYWLTYMEHLPSKENIYTFGESSESVINHYNNHDYIAADYYIDDKQIKELVDFIISSEIMRIGDVTTLLRLHTELIYKDWFMTLLDLKDYIRVKEQMLSDYENRESWAAKSLMNIAKAGFFSSDRTIEEYNRDIWKLD